MSATAVLVSHTESPFLGSYGMIVWKRDGEDSTSNLLLFKCHPDQPSLKMMERALPWLNRTLDTHTLLGVN